MRLLISYRRSDSGPWAGRLRDALRSAFGAQNVFLDFDSIPSGAPFAERIRTAIADADAVVVLIGPVWVDARTPEGERRLDDPEDPVALDVRQALGAGKPVVPVLVGGAPMPQPDALPATLRPLSGLNAAELSDRRWDHDVARLVSDLGGGRRDRRRVAAAVAGVVVAGAAALALVHPWTGGTKTFASADVPFRFDYPRNWKGPLAAESGGVYVGLGTSVGGLLENGIFVAASSGKIPRLISATTGTGVNGARFTDLKSYHATSQHKVRLTVWDYLSDGGVLHERDYFLSVTGQTWRVSCTWYSEEEAAIAPACSRAATSIRLSG